MVMLDEAIGRTICSLEETGLMENSLVVVASDNGGWASVPGNNYPYKGVKGSLLQVISTQFSDSPRV